MITTVLTTTTTATTIIMTILQQQLRQQQQQHLFITSSEAGPSALWMFADLDGLRPHKSHPDPDGLHNPGDPD